MTSKEEDEAIQHFIQVEQKLLEDHEKHLIKLNSEIDHLHGVIWSLSKTINELHTLVSQARAEGKATTDETVRLLETCIREHENQKALYEGNVHKYNKPKQQLKNQIQHRLALIDYSKRLLRL